MAGRHSAATIAAMKLVIDSHMTPYAAAKRAGIDLTTMYKGAIYKLWLAGDTEGARKLMNQSAPKPRRRTKRERYTGAT